MVHMKFGNMSGARGMSDETHLSINGKIKELRYDFKQAQYKKLYGMDNNCAWLFIAALINYFDQESARE